MSTPPYKICKKDIHTVGLHYHLQELDRGFGDKTLIQTLIYS